MNDKVIFVLWFCIDKLKITCFLKKWLIKKQVIDKKNKQKLYKKNYYSLKKVINKTEIFFQLIFRW